MRTMSMSKPPEVQDKAQGQPDKPNFVRLQHLTPQNATLDEVCVEIARLFNVQRDEVAWLSVDKGILRFLFPPALKTAGCIPLSGPGVAARTASTQTSMLSNNFAQVRHFRIFEDVKTRTGNGDAPASMPIQKMMSVPIPGQQDQVRGVLQVSRKGLDVRLAGPDFTDDDLRRLEQVARLIGKHDFV